MFSKKHYVGPHLRERLRVKANLPHCRGWRAWWNGTYYIKYQKYDSKIYHKDLDYTYAKDRKNKNLFSSASLDSNLEDFLIFFQNNINKFIKISKKNKFHICVVAHKDLMKKFYKNRNLDIKKIDNLGVLKIQYTYNTETKKYSNIKNKPELIFDGYTPS